MEKYIVNSNWNTSKAGIEFVNHNDGSTLLISRGRKPVISILGKPVNIHEKEALK